MTANQPAAGRPIAVAPGQEKFTLVTPLVHGRIIPRAPLPCPLAFARALEPPGQVGEDAAVTSIYDFEVETITGERESMAQYRGMVLLIVNTASK